MEKKKLQSFKDLNVWQKSSDLAVLVYKITDKFPKSELYGLTNQMRRAAISVSSNIAEGFKRNHKKEKLQFYNVAYSSTAELESQIEISYKLKYLTIEDYQNVLSLIIEIAKMTDGLIKSIRKPINFKSYILIPFIFLYSIFYILMPFPVQAVTLYFVPQSQTVYQNDSFIVSLMVDTENEEINAIEGYLSFPQDKLEIVDIGKGESVLNLWVKEPSFSNQTGEINFIGGIPEGFNGKGKLISIIFRGISNIISTESVSLSFKKDSRVLLNDGEGTSASLNFKKAEYEIIKKPEGLPVIFSKTHPDQNKWYKETTLHLNWDLIEGTEYSFLLSHDPLEEPDEIADTPEGELIWMGDIEYKGLEDGIYYFTLRQKLPDKKWSESVRFRAMIDATPPEDFQPQITEIEGKKYLVFVAEDKTSGVDYYEVKEGKRDFKRAISPYLLEDQDLRSKIKIKAVDKARNEKVSEIIPPFKVSWKDIIVLLVILIGIGVILWIIRKYFTKKY